MDEILYYQGTDTMFVASTVSYIGRDFYRLNAGLIVFIGTVNKY